jgi:hypothetical protein
MGRYKKYITEEERRQADCEKSMRYYWRHKKQVKRKNLERYYEKSKNKS